MWSDDYENVDHRHMGHESVGIDDRPKVVARFAGVAHLGQRDRVDRARLRAHVARDALLNLVKMKTLTIFQQ